MMQLTMYTGTLGGFYNSGASGTGNTFTFDAPYVFGFSGKSFAYRFIAPVTSNLVKAYYYCTAVTGSPITMVAELREYGNANVPSSTLLASKTFTLTAEANKWFCVTFDAPYQCQAGTPYYVCLSSTDCSVSNSVTIQNTQSNAQNFQGNTLFSLRQTTDGWQTYTNASGQSQTGCIAFSDGTVIGNPYTVSAPIGSNRTPKGLLIGPLGVDVRLVAIQGNLATGTLAIFAEPKTYLDTPDYTTDLSTQIAGTGGVGATVFTPPFTLQGDKRYRIILTPTGNTTNPTAHSCDNDALANWPDVASLKFGGTGPNNWWQFTQWDAANSVWVDQSDWWPRWTLMYDKVSSTTTAASGPQLTVW